MDTHSYINSTVPLLYFPPSDFVDFVLAKRRDAKIVKSVAQISATVLIKSSDFYLMSANRKAKCTATTAVNTHDEKKAPKRGLPLRTSSKVTELLPFTLLLFIRIIMIR